jgi:hypothetical protein
MDHYRKTLNSVGWFIPPYVALGFLAEMGKDIRSNAATFDQSRLEHYLALIHSPEHLSAMVTERYPITPCVQDYKEIIAEAVEAHILGLHHVAVSGLLPVIEGAVKKLAISRGLPVQGVSIRDLFLSLADHCKADVTAKKIGLVSDIVPMLDSFLHYAREHLYTSSDKYALIDKTNRHGILHGAYVDSDYGTPLNFYKTISAVEVLCFISALRASISWFAPSPTDASRRVLAYYHQCASFARNRP